MNMTIVVKTDLKGHPLGASIRVGEATKVLNLHEVEDFTFVKALQEQQFPKSMVGPHNGHLFEHYEAVVQIA